MTGRRGLYRAGIAGCGRIASLYEADKKAKKFYEYLTHAYTLTHHPQVTLVAAADTSRQRRSQFAKRWPGTKVYASATEMLATENLDILVIASGPKSAPEIFRQAAGRVSMVICEKPVAETPDQLQRMAALARRRKTTTAVNVYRNFDSSHLRVRDLMQKGNLGPITAVHAYIGKGLFNQGTHLFSYLVWLLGPVREVLTTGRHSFHDSVEPSYDVVVEFVCGVTAVIQSVDFSNYRLFEVDVLGKRGRVTIVHEGLEFKFYKRVSNRAEKGAFELAEQKPLYASTVGKAFYYTLDGLINAHEGQRDSLFSLEEYCYTDFLLRAVEESYNKQKKIKIKKDLKWKSLRSLGVPR